DVRIPARNLVGEENRGWYVGMTLLDFERSNIGGAVSARRTLDRLIAEIRADADLGARVRSGPLRDEIARRYVETEVMFQYSFRIISMQNAGEIPNYEASTAKLFNSELAQRIAQTAASVYGLKANVVDEGEPGGRYGSMYVDTVPATIRGGTSEVQRNVIATRGLGLPRS
ncbi:MAG: hypothetical protein KC479_09965, partial [Dehalococcoidia bacterium]|nr:hypothetical protein [Dehalococcoidia bacterium]